MCYLYILKSEKDLGYYIGSTNTVDKRIREHNLGKTKSIKHRIPFMLIYLEEYLTKTKARKREIQLKKNYQIRKELLLKIGFKVK
jgi:putative endonuclease